MSSATPLCERAILIRNKYGLHARPAAAFVKLASQFSADVWVTKDGLEVNGKSIMGMMMLAAECGSEVVVRTHGEDAPEALEQLSGLIEQGFGEE